MRSGDDRRNCAEGGCRGGSVLVAVKLPEGKPFAVALAVMIVITVIGLVLGVLIPRTALDAATAAREESVSGIHDNSDLK